MSATSRAGRSTRGYGAGLARLQWTDHLAQDLGGDLGIKRGGLKLLVAEQHLDHADIHLLFEQVGGEAVPQRVQGDLLVDAGREPGLVHGAVQLTGGQRLDGVQSREQPSAVEHLALGTGYSPPRTQPLEHHRREHGVAIFAALALLDTQRHARAIDVSDLQRHHFAGAQTGTIGNREGRLMLEVLGRRDQRTDLLPAQHDRQGAWHEYRLHLRHQLARRA